MTNLKCQPEEKGKGLEIFYLCLGCVSSLINFGILLWTLYLLKKFRRFHISCNYIICGIFISDAIANMIAFPIRGLFSFCKIHTFKSCQASIALTRFTGNISSGLLIMLTAERYIKIAFYIHYKRFFTLKKTKYGIFVFYIISLIICLCELNWGKILKNENDKLKDCFYPMIFNEKYGVFMLLTFQIIPIVITIIIHFFIFFYVQKNLWDYKHYRNSQDETLVGAQRRILRRRKVKVEIRLALTAFFMCGVHIIFVIPIVTLDLIQMFQKITDSKNPIIINPKILKAAFGMVLIYPSIESLTVLITNPAMFKHFYTLYLQTETTQQSMATQ